MKVLEVCAVDLGAHRFLAKQKETPIAGHNTQPDVTARGMGSDKG